MVADWPAFLGKLGQMMSAIGMIGFAFITAWVFGREFVDRTSRIILAIRTPRWVIVAAKFAVAAMWSLVLAGWMLAAAFSVGLVLRLPGLTRQLALESIATVGMAALFSYVLQPVTALLASWGRGYLLPIGLTLVSLLAAQVIGSTGWAAWFPWAVAISSGVPGFRPSPASVMIVILTGVLGLAATVLWWERADQVG
jgi:ABC-2 type transport system permease protein